MFKLDDLCSLLLSSSECLIYFSNHFGLVLVCPLHLERVSSSERPGGGTSLKHSSLTLYIGRDGRMLLRFYSSKNMDIGFTRQLQCQSPFGRAIKLKSSVDRSFDLCWNDDPTSTQNLQVL